MLHITSVGICRHHDTGTGMVTSKIMTVPISGPESEQDSDSQLVGTKTDTATL